MPGRGETRLERFEVATADGVAHPCAALVPEAPRGLCLFLYGGGGSRETLAESRPLWDRWFAEGTLPPVVIATATVAPFGFYLDAPGCSLIARALPEAARRRYGLPKAPPALFGISMGGHAALAEVLRDPSRFGPVVALQPMVEPGWSPGDSPERCRDHYPPGIPEDYLGPGRTEAAWQAHHPAHIARRNRDALRGLPPLYLEAAAEDRYHAHEGAIFLHGVLDDLGAAHTWTLTPGADHVGDSVIPRLDAAAQWLGQQLRLPPRPEPYTDDRQ
jgi:S-formylglutathione hydrolase